MNIPCQSRPLPPLDLLVWESSSEYDHTKTIDQRIPWGVDLQIEKGRFGHAKLGF